MAKLYFRFGTVGSAKTLNLLAVAHNYRQQGKKVLLLKPQLDDRFGLSSIKSRAGLEMSADILVNDRSDLFELPLTDVQCILVDEAQFLSAKHIDQLRIITQKLDVPVICYGLRTDFRTHLFEGTKRLLELSDSIEEVKATCHFCNRKSIVNLRHVNGMAVTEGPTVQLGTEDVYYPCCYSCYCQEIAKATEMAIAGV